MDGPQGRSGDLRVAACRPASPDLHSAVRQFLHFSNFLMDPPFREAEYMRRTRGKSRYSVQIKGEMRRRATLTKGIKYKNLV